MSFWEKKKEKGEEEREKCEKKEKGAVKGEWEVKGKDSAKYGKIKAKGQGVIQWNVTRREKINFDRGGYRFWTKIQYYSFDEVSNRYGQRKPSPMNFRKIF
jgi:hypothetical protein